MFDFDLSGELKIILNKLSVKNRKGAIIINKKIKEIIDNDSCTIDRYHNCSYDLKGYKHVHIDKSFVLLFRVDKDKNHIFFHKFGHHDDFFK